MNKIVLVAICIIFFFQTSVNAQNVNIPDGAFKASLIADTLINTNQDNEISIAEAAADNDTIHDANLGITDLTGNEEFTAISGFNALNNNLTTVDFS